MVGLDVEGTADHEGDGREHSGRWVLIIHRLGLVCGPLSLSLSLALLAPAQRSAPRRCWHGALQGISAIRCASDTIGGDGKTARGRVHRCCGGGERAGGGGEAEGAAEATVARVGDHRPRLALLVHEGTQDAASLWGTGGSSSDTRGAAGRGLPHRAGNASCVIGRDGFHVPGPTTSRLLRCIDGGELDRDYGDSDNDDGRGCNNNNNNNKTITMTLKATMAARWFVLFNSSRSEEAAVTIELLQDWNKSFAVKPLVWCTRVDEQMPSTSEHADTHTHLSEKYKMRTMSPNQSS